MQLGIPVHVAGKKVAEAEHGLADHVALQACANILQHSCVASEGQSGASMWDPSSHRIHSILTGKVWAAGDSSPSFSRRVVLDSPLCSHVEGGARKSCVAMPFFSTPAIRVFRFAPKTMLDTRTTIKAFSMPNY